MLTELQFVSWKLPLVIVRQLSGIDERVVVSVSGLDDFPAYFVSGFLKTRKEPFVFSCFFRHISTSFLVFFLQNRLTAITDGPLYLLVFVKQEAQQQQEDSQDTCRSSQGGCKELVCTVEGVKKK